MADFDDILKERDDLRTELAKVDTFLQSQIDEINSQSFFSGGSLTPEQRSERDRLRASQTDLASMFKQLAFLTIQKLNNSDLLIKLVESINDLNTEIQDELSWLATIEEQSQTAAKITEGLDTLISKIGEIRDSGVS